MESTNKGAVRDSALLKNDFENFEKIKKAKKLEIMMDLLGVSQGILSAAEINVLKSSTSDINNKVEMVKLDQEKFNEYMKIKQENGENDNDYINRRFKALVESVKDMAYQCAIKGIDISSVEKINDFKDLLGITISKKDNRAAVVKKYFDNFSCLTYEEKICLVKDARITLKLAVDEVNKAMEKDKNLKVDIDQTEEFLKVGVSGLGSFRWIAVDMEFVAIEEALRNLAIRAAIHGVDISSVYGINNFKNALNLTFANGKNKDEIIKKYFVNFNDLSQEEKGVIVKDSPKILQYIFEEVEEKGGTLNSTKFGSMYGLVLGGSDKLDELFMTIKEVIQELAVQSALLGIDISFIPGIENFKGILNLTFANGKNQDEVIKKYIIDFENLSEGEKGIVVRNLASILNSILEEVSAKGGGMRSNRGEYQSVVKMINEDSDEFDDIFSTIKRVIQDFSIQSAFLGIDISSVPKILNFKKILNLTFANGKNQDEIIKKYIIDFENLSEDEKANVEVNLCRIIESILQLIKSENKEELIDNSAIEKINNTMRNPESRGGSVFADIKIAIKDLADKCRDHGIDISGVRNINNLKDILGITFAKDVKKSIDNFKDAPAQEKKVTIDYSFETLERLCETIKEKKMEKIIDYTKLMNVYSLQRKSPDKSDEIFAAVKGMIKDLVKKCKTNGVDLSEVGGVESFEVKSKAKNEAKNEDVGGMPGTSVSYTSHKEKDVKKDVAKK